jgi:hypothetical protein
LEHGTWRDDQEVIAISIRHGDTEGADDGAGVQQRVGACCWCIVDDDALVAGDDPVIRHGGGEIGDLDALGGTGDECPWLIGGRATGLRLDVAEELAVDVGEVIDGRADGHWGNGIVARVVMGARDNYRACHRSIMTFHWLRRAIDCQTPLVVVWDWRRFNWAFARPVMLVRSAG